MLHIAPVLESWKKWAMRVAVHTFPAISAECGGPTAFEMARSAGSSISEMMHAREDKHTGGGKKNVQTVLIDAALISTQQGLRISEALSGGSSGKKRSGLRRVHEKRLFSALTRVPTGHGAAAGPLGKTSSREEQTLLRIDHFVESSNTASIALNTALNKWERGRVLMYARAKELRHTVLTESGVVRVMLLK